MPTHIQPFKQDAKVSADADRLAMLHAVTAGQELFGVSEAETNRQGVSYTLDSLEEIQASYERDGVDAELFFILGTDMFLMLGQWHRAEELLRKFAFVTFGRSGYDDESLKEAAERYRSSYGTKVIIADSTRFDVSSTMIRKRVHEGKSIAFLVPKFVDAYIHEHGLYQ
jgi:nicotinate-nucleotide adenylyltransferase